MAIYDFQGPSNLSALLGQGVGQGLGAGLEDILKNKMGQYQQQQQSQRLAPIAKQYGLGGAEVLGEQGLMQLIKQQQQQHQRRQSQLNR